MQHVQHLTFGELAKKLVDASTKVEVGARYTHYKDPTKEYQIKSLGIIEATQEAAVLYEAQYDTPILFIRPVESWCESVEVDGRKVSRFVKIENNG